MFIGGGDKINIRKARTNTNGRKSTIYKIGKRRKKRATLTRLLTGAYKPKKRAFLKYL